MTERCKNINMSENSQKIDQNMKVGMNVGRYKENKVSETNLRNVKKPVPVGEEKDSYQEQQE